MPAVPVPLALRLAATVCVALLLGLGASATARAQAPVVAIADQKTEMFSSPLLGTLGVRHARYVVPWDAMDGGFQRDELYAWMRAARAAKVKPLLSFGHSRRAGRQKLRPTPTALQLQFRRLRKAFPYVTEWATWNEPNHCSQPLCNRPELTARYFDAMKRSCPTCMVLGGEVLDQPNMVSWVRRFRKAAKAEARHWGLHNYIDANRFRTKGTRALLKAVPGQVWFTETGGIVDRRTKVKIPLGEGEDHAADATRWVFDRLATLSPRVRRVYLYHWNTAGPNGSWDSALLDETGLPREAYRVVRARVERARMAELRRPPARRPLTGRGRAADRAR